MNILSIDLGKYKSVFCMYETTTNKHYFGTITTVPQEIHDLIVEKDPDRVVFEIGTPAGWITDIVRALGKPVEVANTTHDAWRWKNVKKKSDRDDALKLAQLSAMAQLPTVHVPQKSVREKRSFIQYRQKLVRRRTQIKNTIRAILQREGIAMAIGKEGWSKEGLAYLKKLAKPLGKIVDFDSDDLWKGQLHTELKLFRDITEAIDRVERKLDKLGQADPNVKILKTAIGIGPRSAEAIAAFLDEPQRFDNAKQVGCYVGLTPRRYQSSDTDRYSRITKQGNKLLRTLLVEISWISLRHNPWARDMYKRLLKGDKKRRKAAIVAVARKLLVRCWAMLRDQTEWNDNISKAAA
jgi:transposase